jgi:hypothetical protein
MAHVAHARKQDRRAISSCAVVVLRLRCYRQYKRHQSQANPAQFPHIDYAV